MPGIRGAGRVHAGEQPRPRLRPGGLVDTLDALAGVGLRTAGAGRTERAASAPAIVELRDGQRIIVVSCAMASSGVPPGWAARGDRPGVDVVEPSDRDAAAIVDRIRAVRRSGDQAGIAVVSVHWGTNWGYDVPTEHRAFAHRLVDGGVDVVHGHSSHHPRPIEIYRDRLILYGCGDFVDDYEGIQGYEEYRDDLRPMYFAALDDGRLTSLRIVVLQARQLRLHRASLADAAWLHGTLDRISRPFGTRVALHDDGTLACPRDGYTSTVNWQRHRAPSSTKTSPDREMPLGTLPVGSPSAARASVNEPSRTPSAVVAIDVAMGT